MTDKYGSVRDCLFDPHCSAAKISRPPHNISGTRSHGAGRDETTYALEGCVLRVARMVVRRGGSGNPVG